MKQDQDEFRIFQSSRVTYFALERKNERMRIRMTLLPIESKEVTKMRVTFIDVSDVHFLGERTELTEIVMLVARDVSGNGLENTKFFVRDYEEEFISFGCNKITAVLWLLETGKTSFDQKSKKAQRQTW